MGIKKPVSKLKKELDSWFSKYIRLREATDTGAAQCFTCGKVDHYKKLQNGHFQSRRHHNTRWNEQNCQVQCVKCNMYSQGEQYKFGKGTAEDLEFLAKLNVKMTRVDYVEMISYYKDLVNKIKKEKNIE